MPVCVTLPVLRTDNVGSGVCTFAISDKGSQVRCHVRGANEDVVQVDKGLGDVRQEVVHLALTRLGEVLQPKWHEQVFIQA